METLKELISIESGSADIEGLDKCDAVIGECLKALGGKVEIIEPGSDIYRMFDTPEKIGKMVKATFAGAGTKRILLLAHMDTVYPRGTLAQQPFKIESDRAWGLGIADDKHGIAVILHTLTILKAMNFREHGTVTVLINGDEEVSSPASRHLITRLGTEHDAVMSFEGGGAGRRGFRPARLRRAFDQRGIRPDRFHRAPTVIGSQRGPRGIQRVAGRRGPGNDCHIRGMEVFGQCRVKVSPPPRLRPTREHRSLDLVSRGTGTRMNISMKKRRS